MSSDEPSTMNTVKLAKVATRMQMKAILSTITKEEKHRQSQVVTQKLINSSAFQKANRISIFLSMHDEVNTDEILKHCLEAGKVCFIPRYDSKSRHMEMVKIHSLEDYNSLPETSWKIKQPLMSEERDEALSTGGLDFVLVPGLAFTAEGHRLGRGRGYYDTFLSKCLSASASPPALVAVAFRQQLLPSVPTDDTDITVDTVITA